MVFLRNRKKIYQAIICIVVSFWLVLSVVRVGYGYLKIYTQEKDIIFLSDEQKKQIQFGDLHNFYTFVNTHTESNSKIAFLSPGRKAYFLSRYYVHPRKIYYAQDTQSLEYIMKAKKIDYIVVYQTPDKELNENDSMQWQIQYKNPKTVYKKNKNIGYIFQIKS